MLMDFLKQATGVLAPVFIVLSPILSYSDQALSMHRNKSSAGFSLDIPLIMLIASLLKIFYWPSARFDSSLLLQAILMVFMQVALLKIGLDHRPSPRGGEAALPFAGAGESSWAPQRPYNFWQWRSPKPYWQFLLYLSAGLLVLEFVLSPWAGLYMPYASLLGYVGLGVEATLPIPQILTNARSRSCRGFRFSVMASWIIGDSMKMFWFFTSSSTIPLAFKACGMFQACCDSFLGVQYFMYGDGGPTPTLPLPPAPPHEAAEGRDLPLETFSDDFMGPRLARVSSTDYGAPPPVGRHLPAAEKGI